MEFILFSERISIVCIMSDELTNWYLRIEVSLQLQDYKELKTGLGTNYSYESNYNIFPPENCSLIIIAHIIDIIFV